MEKEKEIIIHVGLPKTGTTSIQKTMYDEDNKKILRKNNINILENWYSNNGYAIYSSFCDNPEDFVMNIRSNLSGLELEKKNNSDRNDIIRECNNPERLLISGESICNLTFSELKRMKNFIEDNAMVNVKFKIMLCIRSPKTISSSLYQQFIKSQDNIVTDEFIKDLVKLMLGYSKKFVDVFGKENVDVFSFEEACESKEGLSAYFFKRLGIDEDLEKLNYIRENESICFEATEIGKYINDRYPLFENKKIKEGRDKLDILVLKKIKGSKFSISKSLLLEIYDYVYPILVELLNEFGIDYTNEREEILKIIEVEHFYDEESVCDAYIAATDFIKKVMIEYFYIKNIDLAKRLEQI